MSRWTCFALLVILSAVANPLAASELDRDVLVEDVRASPHSVHGRVRNLEDGELRDIRLLITHTFLWDDEMHPGENNPGRTDIFTIPGPIAPRGGLTFEEKLVPPLPARSDGYYQTSVQVLGFTRVGP
jgi:hypothetical protein